MSIYEVLQSDDEDQESSGVIKGVAIGIVTNNQDTEGMGRVKVRFPWRENDDESYWARIAVTMAGAGRGTVFLPEIDDEVLVVFEREDIRHPYIIGGLWNGEDDPPETNADGKNNIRIIKSRSGHVLIFNDDAENQQESIEIRTNAGHSIILDDTAGSENIFISDKSSNNSIYIDSVSNDITIESGMSLKIKSTKIDIEADSSISIKAGTTLTLQGALVKIN